MRRRVLSKWIWASGLAIGAMSLPTYATITVDGTLNESDYGASAPGTSALATQTINDSFGVNTSTTGATTASALDAAYGVVENNTLYLFLAGNINNNSSPNILQVFIDDGRAGMNTLAGIPSTAGNLKNLDGSMFSPSFNATYALEINETKSATNANNGTVFVDQYDLVNNKASFIGDFNATAGVGNSNETGSTENTIQVGLNDNNIGGIIGDTAGGAANQTNAQTVNTGIELAIPLSILGNPTTGIKVMADINGSGDSGPSNQFLPGLEAGTPSVKKGPSSSTNPYYLLGQGNATTNTGTDFTFAAFPNEYFTVPNSIVPNGIWLPTSSGSWSTASNWSNGVIPDGAGASANFPSSAGGSDITLDGTRTVGSISINSGSSSYSIDPGTPADSMLIMDNGTSNASISDLGGIHIIDPNIQLNSTTVVSAPNHGDAVYIQGNISGNGGLTTAGSTILNNLFGGIVLLGDNTYTGPTVIQAGELQLGSATALPIGTALTLDSASPRGVLDLDGNSVTISSLADNGNTVTIMNDGGAPATLTYAGTNANPSTYDGNISDVSGSTTSLLVASGSLTLAGTNTYLGTTTVNAGATLTLSSTANKSFVANATITNNGTLKISGIGTLATITGTGTLSVSNKLQLVAGSGATQQTGLNITGTLDITNNALVIAYGSTDPIATIVGYIKSGYDTGKWDGVGLISSAAASTPGTSIGYADGSTDAGTAAASATILVRYTWLGDLNLDGAVTSSDLTTMTADSGMTHADWAQGDLNYDGIVNADDFALLALGAADSQGATLPLPEPASAALLPIPLLLASRRRRRLA